MQLASNTGQRNNQMRSVSQLFGLLSESVAIKILRALSVSIGSVATNGYRGCSSRVNDVRPSTDNVICNKSVNVSGKTTTTTTTRQLDFLRPPSSREAVCLRQEDKLDPKLTIEVPVAWRHDRWAASHRNTLQGGIVNWSLDGSHGTTNFRENSVWLTTTH